MERAGLRGRGRSGEPSPRNACVFSLQRGRARRIRLPASRDPSSQRRGSDAQEPFSEFVVQFEQSQPEPEPGPGPEEECFDKSRPELFDQSQSEPERGKERPEYAQEQRQEPSAKSQATSSAKSQARRARQRAVCGGPSADTSALVGGRERRSEPVSAWPWQPHHSSAEAFHDGL